MANDHWTEALRRIEAAEGGDALDLSHLEIETIPDAVARLQGLRTLHLGGTQITDACLDAVAHLQGLQALDLSRTQITDAGLDVLTRLQGLRTLYLGSTQITDAGLDAVARLQGLQKLYLFDTQITDAGLDAVARLRGLERLWVQETSVADLRPLLALPSLHDLRFVGTEATRLDPTLQELSLNHDDAECTRLTMEYLRGLEVWPPVRDTEPPSPRGLAVRIASDGRIVPDNRPDDVDPTDAMEEAHEELKAALADLGRACPVGDNRFADLARDVDKLDRRLGSHSGDMDSTLRVWIAGEALRGAHRADERKIVAGADEDPRDTERLPHDLHEKLGRVAALFNMLIDEHPGLRDREAQRIEVADRNSPDVEAGHTALKASQALIEAQQKLIDGRLREDLGLIFAQASQSGFRGERATSMSAESGVNVAKAALYTVMGSAALAPLDVTIGVISAEIHAVYPHLMQDLATRGATLPVQAYEHLGTLLLALRPYLQAIQVFCAAPYPGLLANLERLEFRVRNALRTGRGDPRS